jgi:hypothetical protein
VDSAFAADVTGLEFAVMTQTDDFIIFYLDMANTWDINQLMAATEAIREALVTGYEVRLMSATFVKLVVKGQKTDSADVPARAIKSAMMLLCVRLQPIAPTIASL